MLIRLVALAAASVLLAGCLTPTEVANPNAITLRQAVFDVASSLHEVRDAYASQPRIGMYPSEATVTFNISSQSTDTTGLQIGASSPAAITGIPITASFSDQIVATGSRGNQISIKFVNILDHPPTLQFPGRKAAKVDPKKDKKDAKADPNEQKKEADNSGWAQCLKRGYRRDVCDPVLMREHLSPEQQDRILKNLNLK